MKKCPACGKTFEDSMKFCQIDGTELVADEPAFDPYATVVGHKLDLTPEPAKPAETAGEEIVIAPIEEMRVEIGGEPLIHETTGSVPIAPPDEVLELPGLDPLKTMYVSEAELKEVFSAEGKDEAAPPPSPFSTPEITFDQPSPYADAETVLAQNAAPPFREPDPVQWTPPEQDAAWQNQQMAANTSFQSAPSGVDGQSKGLAIGSLVSGILSCLCCLPIVTGPTAIILGFVAKNKADENPAEFGGRGLALGGMITGGIGILFGILQLIWIIFWGGLNVLLGGR